MGRVEGKVAFITGAARGQGRSHAVRLAQEGADIIAVDIAAQIETSPFAMATPADLEETVRQVEALDRRIIATQTDVRDFDALKTAVDDGVAQLGRLDIVAANAGVGGDAATAENLSERTWQDGIDVNLTGVWHAAKAAIPHIKAGGRGGSIAITSSVGGLKGLTNTAAYVAAKHGIVGLMRALALELAPDMIRVNTIHPTNTNTEMIHNEAIYELFTPDLTPEERTRETLAERFQTLNTLPIPWVEPIDVSNALLWLASDEARYVTGITLPIDAGALLK